MDDTHVRKLVVLQPGCRLIAHELLNAMSVYAFGLELGVPVIEHRAAGKGIAARALRAMHTKIIRRFKKDAIIEARREFTFLPPTRALKRTLDGTAYFIGWVFRNPLGLEKYRAQLLERFLPKQARRTDTGKTIIGVHMRQEPFKGFPDGEFLLSPARMREAVDEYVAQRQLKKEDVEVLIVSDAAFPAETFAGYRTRVARTDNRENLFLLSTASVVIGDNSIYSNLAAWFGNAPHIVVTPEPIDWEYYAGKTTYFDNKYATFAL